MYTIKQAATRTGVPVELLRAWERRYGIVQPERTASGYRLYDDVALDRIRTMRRLVGEGWAPSVAAAAVLRGDAPAGSGSGAAAELGIHSSEDSGDRTEPSAEPALADAPSLIEAFVTAAAALDTPRLEAVLDRMLAAGSFELVTDRLLLPALVALGNSWAGGRIGVAEEHAASHAILRRLAAAFQAAGRPTPASGATVVGLPPGCRHELAALAFAVAARRAGLPILYLGPDLPVEDWAAAARNVAARAAVVGAPTDDDVEAAARVAAAIRVAAPGIVVAFGGRAARAAAAAGGRDALILPDGVGRAVDSLVTALADST